MANIDQDIAALVGAKEIQIFKMGQDLQHLANQYNEMLATWAFIDGFLKPLMELQLKAYRARHAPLSIAGPKTPESIAMPPSTLFSDQPAEAVIGGASPRTA